MITSRHAIRIKAFQALFQLTSNFRINEEEAIKNAITYSLDKDFEDLSELEIIAEILPVKNPTEKQLIDSQKYLHDLVKGVKENQKMLDQQIEKKLKNWSIQRIETTNLLILRLATYELYFEEETDPRIIINEAIELTKLFNNEEASKFVNGVLQGILDEKEA